MDRQKGGGMWFRTFREGYEETKYQLPQESGKNFKIFSATGEILILAALHFPVI
jgi:hypothetical protein